MDFIVKREMTLIISLLAFSPYVLHAYDIWQCENPLNRCVSLFSFQYLLPIRQSPQPGSSNSSPEPNYPLFVFSRSRSSEYHVDEVAESVYKPMQQQLRNMMNQNEATDTWSDDDDETDEFVII